MVGLTIGLATGCSVGVEVGIDVPTQTPAAPKLFVIVGYSQDIGMGKTANVTTTPTWQVPDLATAFADVRILQKNSLGGDPPTFVTEGPSALAPRTLSIGGGVFAAPSFGIELTLGRDLDAANIGTIYLAKYCIDSSGLAAIWNNAAYPTGGPAIRDQFISFIQSTAATFGVTDLPNNLVIVMIEGVLDTTYATCLAQLDAFFAATRAALGNHYILLERLQNKQDTPRGAISAIEDFASSNSKVALVKVDALLNRGETGEGSAGDLHYSSDSYALWGVAGAAKAVTLLSGTTPANPRFMGMGPITIANSAQGITPTMPRHQAGDILIFFVSGAFGGGGYPLTTANGFVEVTNSPQMDYTRVQAWWCRATSSSMPAPVMADVVGDDAKVGAIIVIRGAVASGNPFDDVQGSTVGAAPARAGQTTAVTFPAVTTAGANRLILHLLAHNIDSTGPQISAWTNAALTDVTEEVDFDNTAGVGYGMGVATGVKAAAGSTGSTTATLAVQAPQARLTLAVKP